MIKGKTKITANFYTLSGTSNKAVQKMSWMHVHNI